MITASTNNQIRNLIQLQTKASARKKQKLFVVEGIKIVLETPVEYLQQIYISEEALKDKELLSKLKNKLKEGGKTYEEACVEVSSKVFKAISDTVTPQGIIAVVRQQTGSLKHIIKEKEKSIVLILESLRDPGNMGTIIRTAEGAGVDCILMNGECVDMYNPKVTRSTMGSIYRVPMVVSDNFIEDIRWLKSKEYKIFAAHLNGQDYDRHPAFCGKTGIIIGNEANGISEQVAAEATELIRIPMCGKVESLNAAIAAAILMYEAKSR